MTANTADGESDRASRLYVLRLHAPKRSSPGSYSYDNYLELVGRQTLDVFKLLKEYMLRTPMGTPY